MTQKEVVDELKEIIVERLRFDPARAAEMTLETTLPKGVDGSLGLDSLDFIELSVAIEERFGIMIDETEDLSDEFLSLDSLSRFILAGPIANERSRQIPRGSTARRRQRTRHREPVRRRDQDVLDGIVGGHVRDQARDTARDGGIPVAPRCRGAVRRHDGAHGVSSSIARRPPGPCRGLGSARRRRDPWS